MRMARLRGAATLATITAFLMAPGVARADADFVDEVKIGVLYHDIGIFGDNREEGADINFEALFVSPNWLYDDANPSWVNRLLNPRPNIGASINTEGDTSQFYFGLNWQWDLLTDIARPEDGIFFGFSAGGAVHDGKLDTHESDRKSLGSRVLFHLAGEVGYRFTERLSLSVYLEHSSNAWLADRNDGYDDLGMRLGIKF